ncbi:NUDIX hydrolase [Halobaculum magnesiiphilum]|uniref:NUDIX hydrolase n=1 Tax=Halobaculum magnesiiphilum TaxID=1017351 RepID=A0A8T8WCM2_9EURY|nr:NUDIX hydrolase [Halobaculum magnesiiphilum]QZP37588.1 NUDIX hydrolase [Halobaculum magnesiiphilum]
MITVAGDYCPLCGSELDRVVVEGRERRRCPGCDRVVWQNSKPVASVVVRDDEEVLLGRREVDPNRGLWGVPGGNLEHDEHPAAGVARELREETGVRVDPSDLRLFDVDHTTTEHRSVVGIRYVVDRAVTAGEPTGRDETSAARFAPPEWFRERGGISPWDRDLLAAVFDG